MDDDEDDDDNRVQAEIQRLDGVIEEIEQRLHDIDFALAESNRRLFAVVIIAAVGFAALLGSVAAMYMSFVF